jgi:hypothetical protein
MSQASFCKTVYYHCEHFPCYEWELSFFPSLYNYIDWRCFRTERWEMYLDSRRTNSSRQKRHITSFIVCTIYRILVAGSSQGEVENKWHKNVYNILEGKRNGQRAHRKKNKLLIWSGGGLFWTMFNLGLPKVKKNLLTVRETVLFPWRTQSHDVGTKKAQK